jgi:glycosyltransferase involved in cell wall biosynthesis
MMTEISPKVTICVVTYNQVKYVEQCIQSLLSQKTNFKFDIIISDDCSTDGTIEILRGLQKKNSDVIRLYLSSKNRGASANFRYVHSIAKGEYIAHMDGDDYALPGKLQTQADFLDANPLCQILWHRMEIEDISSGEKYIQKYDGMALAKMRFYVNHVIINISLGIHSSKMYRRWNRFDDVGLNDLDFSENVMHLQSTSGYAAFLESGTYGVYRINIGISRSRSKIRVEIYRWMEFFYRNKIGARDIIAAKVLLMLLSDIKHKSASFIFGAKVFLKMTPNLSYVSISTCKNTSALTSLARSQDAS